MALLKTANKLGKYHDIGSLSDVIRYITNPQKTIHNYIGYFGVDPRCAAFCMKLIAEVYKKETGVQLRHFIIAFEPEELCRPEVVFEIGKRVSQYLAQEYQVIFAVHEDKPSLHVHIVFNPVSFLDGHRYRGTKEAFYAFKAEVKRILADYQIDSLKYVSADNYQGG